MSDEEADSLPEPSDPETQFIPQEDDDETLWEVIEITAQKGNKYKVRWKGNDPATQKPWPQSWVPKHDCTDDLVLDWKLKQAMKKKKRNGSKRESGISKKPRTSTKSSTSALTSIRTASPSKLDSVGFTRRSTSTTATAVNARRGRSKVTLPSPSVYTTGTRSREPVEIYSPSPLSHNHAPSRSSIDVSPTRSIESLTPNTPTAIHKTGTKRKHGETTSTTTSARIPASSTFPTAEAEGDARTNHISGSIPPPRKRRKLQVEPVTRSMQTNSSAEVEDERRNRKSRSRVILSDDDMEVKTGSDAIAEPQSRDLTSPKTEAEEEEAEERMIEESLSDIYCTPCPSSPLQPSSSQEDESTPTPPVRAHPSRRLEDAVEDTPTVSRPQRGIKRRMDSPPADPVGTTSKPDPPSKTTTRPSTSSSSSTAVINPTVSGTATKSRTRTTTTTKHRVLTSPAKSKATTEAIKRKKALVPAVSKEQWEELSDFQSQQVAEPEVVQGHDNNKRSISEEGPDLDGMYLDDPFLPPPPSAKSVPDQASGSRTGSVVGSGSNSVTGHQTKSTSLPRSGGLGSSAPSAPSSTGIVVPTTPPRNGDGDANGAEYHHRSSPDAKKRLEEFDKFPRPPILSPDAKKRLQQFDKFVMRIELGNEKGKEKEQRLQEDDAIPRKVNKGKQKENNPEMAVAGGSGKEERGLVRTFEEKKRKGKEKEQILPDESDSGDVPAVRSTGKGKSKSKSISKETSQPPNSVLRSHDSDSHDDERARRRESKSKSKEKDKEQLNQCFHHPSDSGVESSVMSDAGDKSGSKKLKTKSVPRQKPATSRSRLADTEEVAAAEDNSSATRTGTANSKLTDRETTSKPVSKTVSKPQSEVGTNTAQSKPPSSTTNQRSANPRSHSFVDDIIPETEESLSQSQEMQVDSQTLASSHIPDPPATPPRVNIRSTLKSRMKLKTPQNKSKPLSRTSSAVGALALGIRLDMDIGIGRDIVEEQMDGDNGAEKAVKKTSNKKANETGATTKPFGPIRKVSPSVFKAHLPSSSLPESITESIEGDGDDSVKRAKSQNEEDDSIEQFESPVKGIGSGERWIDVLNLATRQEKDKQRAKESASVIWDSDLNHRGQELAEAARKREKERLRAEETSALPASTSIKPTPRAENALSPPDVILLPEDTNSVVQQMENAYVDLSGGIHEDQVELAVDSNDVDMDTGTGTGIVEQPLDPIHLRQEEEESTQDLMMELDLYQQQQGTGVKRSGDLAARVRDDSADLPPVIQIDSQPVIEAMLEEDTQKSHADNPSMDDIPSILVERPSRDPSARSYSSLEDESHQKPRSRTSKCRSRSRSLPSQESKNEKEANPNAEIPPTASTHRESLQALSQPTDSQTENVEDPHHLGAAMHLLNTKSEEISKLEGQLSAAQQTNEDLLQQLSALRSHLTESTNGAQPATKSLEQELTEARAQLAFQAASWENERVALILNIEAATRGKASAEQDRDFFREQYAKASAFVSSVRDENAELEKRIKIATDQAQSGVSLIKATFELRTKSLEEDVRAWRRMADFLMEKDRRTNDDIRKRAAEEPELRARCDRQEGVLEETSERLEQLEMELEEKQRLYLEAQDAGKRWKEATVKLNLELNEAKTKLERIGKVGIGDGDESAHPHGHEFVYRCEWRPDDSNDTCEAVFLNISELQEHLYTGGHLQPD